MARLRHIAIATKDPAKTAAFYQKVFGLKFVKQVPDSPAAAACSCPTGISTSRS